mgnify:CR=1 FL=1
MVSKKVIVGCFLCDGDLTVEVSGAYRPFRGGFDPPESPDLEVTSTCGHVDAYFQETTESGKLYDKLYEEVMDELVAQEYAREVAYERWRDNE